MKTLFFTTVLLLCSASTWSSSQLELHENKSLVCPLYHAYKLKSKVEDLPNDKLIHCSLSCMISLYCTKFDVFSIGVIKEVADALGMGDPDYKDILANIKGIELSSDAQEDEECIPLCENFYGEGAE